MMRSGIGYDVHAVAAGRPMMLGCLHFEDAPAGLSGHSDADVVSHAICDALLGAAGLGDIGEHFPDTDEAWKNAPGREFLSRVAGMVRAAGFTIVNVDCTVVCDVLRLGERKRQMAHEIAGHLGVAESHVNVKATTFEGKGAIGRGEAVACEAICALETSQTGPMESWREAAL
jgi:2-C-methyl-D-erythritol 2,4-cyclodiphosphate synthase